MSALSHILASDPEESANPPPPPPPAPPAQRTTPPASDVPVVADVDAAAMPPKKYMPTEDGDNAPRDEASAKEDNDADVMMTSTTTSTRRNASGSVSSVYSGNKIRHLKKEDGIPLWRKDIQYDFLRLVFRDETRCFTKYSDGSKGWTFAEIYIDAMAKSSKCSKILKEKLLQDVEGALAMAMVCLLVNVGRMNTTLNFFPEMRAQLRTYHSIPALQAHQDPNAYKQLQDAPRLKSILKGATEDEPQPSTVEEILAANRPRTNPVNLIFVMSQYAPKISETHFQTRDFFDLVMRGSLSSASRARAFLWLIWWYLESDFGYEDSQRNPFGAGQYGEGEEGTGVLPLKTPPLESLTEEQMALENVDEETEKTYGEVKRNERTAILASEPSPAMTALKRARKEKGLHVGPGGAPVSDDDMSEPGWSRQPTAIPPASRGVTTGYNDMASDYTRSPSPVGRGFSAVNAKPDMRINNLLNNDDVYSATASPPGAPVPPPAAPLPIKKGPGRGNWRRHKPKPDATPSSARPQDGPAHPVPLLPSMPNQNPQALTPQALSFVADGPQNMQPPTPSAYPSSLYNTGLPYQQQHPRDHVPTPSYQASKRNRGVTQHQSALNIHRKQRIDYTLDRRIQEVHTSARRQREREGPVVRAWKRIRLMPPGYDSEEENIKLRKLRDRAAEGDERVPSNGSSKEKNGAAVDSFADDERVAGRRPKVLMAGIAQAPEEPSDYGEEAKDLARVFARCERRLERWEHGRPVGVAMMRRREMEARRGLYGGGAVQAPPGVRRGAVGQETLDGGGGRRQSGREGERMDRMSVGETYFNQRRPQAEELDDEDREMLGEVDMSEDEEMEDDEDD